MCVYRRQEEDARLAALFRAVGRTVVAPLASPSFASSFLADVLTSTHKL